VLLDKLKIRCRRRLPRGKQSRDLADRAASAKLECELSEVLSYRNGPLHVTRSCPRKRGLLKISRSG
jgi:hypothetical protein